MLGIEISFPPVEELAEQEKLKDYQKRVSEWIGDQGVFFQLRYARTIGTKSFFKQLGGMLAKLVVVLAILAGIGYFLIGAHFKGDSYKAKIDGNVESALGLSEIEAKGFSRSRGSGGYRNLNLEGGAKSFFYEAKVADFSAPFSFWMGLTTAWNPDTVKMEEAEFSLKAGGDSKEMEEAYSGVLESLKGDGVTSITIDDFSCDWGYSKLTYGRISNSKFNAELENGKWDVSLVGGDFQQNWLQAFEIVKGRLLVSDSRIEVVSLELRSERGSLELAGSIGAPISKPEFALSGKFTKLAVENLLKVEGVTVRDFVAGHLSGDLKISGSTNSMVKIEGTASPALSSSLTIRERWPILKAISIMDTQRTFRRIDFHNGSFGFTTEGGNLKISDIDLLAKDTAKLAGHFETRLPNQEEAAHNLGITLTDGFSDDATDSSLAQKLEDDRMSLRNALTKRSKVDDLQFDRSGDDSERRDREADLSSKELEELRLVEEMKTHRITGDLKIAIPASSFGENENLARIYPADEDGWRWIDIALHKTRFSDISKRANEKILGEARIRSSAPNE